MHAATHQNESLNSSNIWMRRFYWVLTILADAVIVAIGIQKYYLEPIDSPYPFVFITNLLSLPPSPQLNGLLTFLAIGATPVAALLMLVNSMSVLVLKKGSNNTIRLAIGAFCTSVGFSFIATLVVYALRAPDVLNWYKEIPATFVHLFIAGRGLWLVADVSPLYGPVISGLWIAASTLWLILVAIPQHPWLVVWVDTVRDLLGRG